MNIIRTQSLSAMEKADVLELWNNEYPAQLAFESLNAFENYLRVLSRPLHYMVVKNGNVVAWAFAFDRDGERWFAIIISNTIQRSGYGTALMQELKEDNPVLNGWVITHNNYKKSNGETYFSPSDFYLKSDFNIFKDKFLETEKLSVVKITWNCN